MVYEINDFVALNDKALEDWYDVDGNQWIIVDVISGEDYEQDIYMLLGSDTSGSQMLIPMLASDIHMVRSHLIGRKVVWYESKVEESKRDDIGYPVMGETIAHTGHIIDVFEDGSKEVERLDGRKEYLTAATRLDYIR